MLTGVCIVLSLAFILALFSFLCITGKGEEVRNHRRQEAVRN